MTSDRARTMKASRQGGISKLIRWTAATAMLSAVLAFTYAQSANPPYNARFTFTRVRYGGGGFRGGASWAHDYPRADLNLPTVLSEISKTRPTLGSSNVFD